jgi:hypothetical protein
MAIAVRRVRLLYADRVGAGASANARFRELSGAWWARNRVIGLASTIPLLLLALVCTLLWPAHRGFFAGFGIGSAIVLYATAASFFPEHIDRWQRGAEGEKRTARRLRPLARARDWTVVHDRAARFGNLDHVLVGPAGVYLLDTKTPGGIVSVQGGVMKVHRRDDPDDVYEQRRLAAHIKRTAAELAAELARTTGQRSWVSPVVVIWAEFQQHAHEQNGVAWVQGKALKQ